VGLVLFGSGTRMFEHLGSEHLRLETAAAIRLQFRIVK
jgi:hypothetical protein